MEAFFELLYESADDISDICGTFKTLGDALDACDVEEPNAITEHTIDDYAEFSIWERDFFHRSASNGKLMATVSFNLEGTNWEKEVNIS